MIVSNNEYNLTSTLNHIELLYGLFIWRILVKFISPPFQYWKTAWLCRRWLNPLSIHMRFSAIGKIESEFRLLATPRFACNSSWQCWLLSIFQKIFFNLTTYKSTNERKLWTRWFVIYHPFTCPTWLT